MRAHGPSCSLSSRWNAGFARRRSARLAIGGSGVARGDLAPFLPASRDEWLAMSATHPDDPSRALRDAVARQHSLRADEVRPAVGASEADAATVLGLAGPGARVVERPAYRVLIRPTEAFGCRVARVDRPAEDRFALCANDVAAAMAPDTRAVILARPNNPTGAAAPARSRRSAARRRTSWCSIPCSTRSSRRAWSTRARSSSRARARCGRESARGARDRGRVAGAMAAG